MRVLVSCLTGLFLALAPPAWAGTGCPFAMPGWLADQAMPLAQAHARLADRPVLKIVAVGSSSTQGIGASGSEFTYPVRLEALLRAALPGIHVKVINRGVGGEDAAQNIARFDADVLALRPAIVIWQVGANMAMRQGDPLRFRTLVERGIDLLRSDGADVILVDSQAAPGVLAAPRNQDFIAAVGDAARARDVGLFPRFALMEGWRARNGTLAEGLIGPDRLHHTDAGYACFAEGLAAMILAGLR